MMHRARSPLNHEKILGLVETRAENLFASGRMLCSEAVLSVLNSGFKGGLPPEMAVRLASGLPEGMGGAGCLCGALGGGVMCLGLFMTHESPNTRDRARVRAASRDLHNRFKERFGSTCCRALSMKVKDDPRAYLAQCIAITGVTARMTAEIFLGENPKLMERVDLDYLSTRDGKLQTGLKKLAGMIRR